MMNALNPNQFVETGVIVSVLIRDAESIGIDLGDESIYSLARKCANKVRELNYPRKQDFTRFNAYRRGSVVGTNLTKDEVSQSILADAVIEDVVDTDGFNAAIKKYQEDNALITQVFVWGLFYLTDTLDNGKAQKAYSIAYDKGHSSGFEEVAGEFDSLLPLIK